ncbi:hypothetical protein ACA910_015006 [Epithemia clementina (nom. ined.)]
MEAAASATSGRINNANDTGDGGSLLLLLPPEIVEKLEAGAFRQLCRHLQERSDAVSNMDLMTLSGFCRNCLAKWMVVEARSLVDQPTSTALSADLIRALNTLGYEETAQYVYGMPYDTWKKRHQKKATDEQMEKYNASAPLHAQHDKALLAPRLQPKQQQQQLQQPQGAADSRSDTNEQYTETAHHPPLLQHPQHNDPVSSSTPIVVAASTMPPETQNFSRSVRSSETRTTAAAATPVPPSNVCCQDVNMEDDTPSNRSSILAPTMESKRARWSTPPPAPSWLSFPTIQEWKHESHTTILRLAILTVSDRAYRGLYETGDLSGPAVEQALQTVWDEQQQQQQRERVFGPSFDNNKNNNNNLQFTISQRSIVPDDMDAICNQLLRWCDPENKNNNRDSNSDPPTPPLPQDNVDLILTTGGTGMGARDVTPEATRQVLDVECHGLLPFVLMECSQRQEQQQPLATLSRGTAGLCGSTLIANLPGNPAAVHEIMPLLLPLLLHAKNYL